MTIRSRLMVGLLAVLALLIAAVGTAEVLVLRHVLYQRSAQDLRNELALLGAAPLPAITGGSAATGSCAGLSARLPPRAATQGGGPRPGKGRFGPSGPAGAAAVAQTLAAKGIASAIAGPDGTLLACAAAGRDGRQSSFTVPTSMLSQLATTAGYATARSQGHHLLGIGQPIGADTAILVTDLSDVDAALRVVEAVTVLGGLTALAAAAGLSRPLLRSGLAPLRRVAQTADAIAGGDLDRRTELARSTDEVGQLAAAFDRMIDRLQATLIERDGMVEQLRAQEQTMRRFVADASHELRTPLTAIRGGAQVLRLGAASDPHDLAESLGHIQTQTERMSRLVDDLLLLSRQDSGQPTSTPELIDLGQLIDSQHSLWQALAGSHPLDIATQPAGVIADADAMTRVCGNLIDNAAKYSPADTPITVRVAASSDRVELSVTDRGPGIPPRDRTRIFERFYRGDPARARTTGGAGLGLAIVASVVADHHGHVQAEDSPGGGTRMVIDLPTGCPP